jgi:rare lipoprotein A
MRLRIRCGVIGCVVWTVALAGCGVFRRHPHIESQPGAVEVGTASWYGPGFHGNRTSSGEIYDQYELTAAHQTLPLGTRVAVTNLQNGRSVEVRINDRGPFVKSRAIDLSYAAAQTIGMLGPGTVPVRIEVLVNDGVQLTPAAYTAAYTVQVGAFSDRTNASRLQHSLAQRFDGVYLATLDAPRGTYYRIRIGKFGKRDEAVAFARGLVPMGLSPVIMEDDGRP